eukprot:12035329-Heterocapsa_arctica.AAC.1
MRKFDAQIQRMDFPTHAVDLKSSTASSDYRVVHVYPGDHALLPGRLDLHLHAGHRRLARSTRICRAKTQTLMPLIYMLSSSFLGF